MSPFSVTLRQELLLRVACGFQVRLKKVEGTVSLGSMPVWNIRRHLMVIFNIPEYYYNLNF